MRSTNASSASGAFASAAQVEVTAQSIELAVARREVEREVSTLLEDANLPHSLARHAARRDVRDDARVERDARIRNVDERRQHRNADGRHVRDVTSHEREHEVDVVNHEIEHDGDVRPAGIEWREPVTVDESRRLHERERRTDRSIESLDVARLDQRARPLRDGEQIIGFGERCGERLLDEQMPATFSSAVFATAWWAGVGTAIVRASHASTSESTESNARTPSSVATCCARSGRASWKPTSVAPSTARSSRT